ncbi:induced myeloid leukemia cell differentiation protein Mcl-1-like [Syngnathoides biaculeatus]|uniref:induced myeloid leukemia cell differentiation protein Mcl-1-like n=1 Tax=Syngnathoides biaculeatus TaxID=300417 RepID=UPI002ADDC88A|nr:induced myeloid leukemia cell differentiation protein Mcl-1-like [Syngnathoides biaculeatus]
MGSILYLPCTQLMQSFVSLSRRDKTLARSEEGKLVSCRDRDTLQMMPTQRHLLRPNSNLGIAPTLMFRPNPVPEGVFGFPQPAVAPAVNPEMGNHDSPDPGPGALPGGNRRPEGSPPPELQTPGDPDALATDTRRLIGRFLTDFTGLTTTASWEESKVHSTIKRVVQRLVDKHRLVYNHWVGLYLLDINNPAMDRRGDDMAFVSNVARLEFADGATNWGRVASLLAFAAVLSQALKEMRREGCVALVAQEVSTYLLSHQRTWLVQHNAWNGFAEFFEEDDVESRVRTVLVAFGGLACISAAVLRLLR